MREEEHVPQLDRPAAIVLGELVLIKLREGRRQSLLHLAGERRLAVLPVNGNELGEFVGALDDASERLRNQSAMRLVASHLADKQQWHMAQLHLLARLYRQPRDLLNRNLRHEFGDAAGDLDSVLVELAFPKQASQHRAPQLQLRRNLPRRSTFMRATSKVEFKHVESCHCGSPFIVRIDSSTAVPHQRVLHLHPERRSTRRCERAARNSRSPAA